MGNGNGMTGIAGDGIGGRCLSPLPVVIPFSWSATGSYYSTNYTENATNFTAIIWTNGTGTFAPNASVALQVLVVAGGGGSMGWGGGGGGAGGMIYTSKVLNSGAYSISVGSGGIGTVTRQRKIKYKK